VKEATVVSGDAGLIERGLAAWANGDLDALEAILDPDVTLHAVEPGRWDCPNRERVMALLRKRQSEGLGVYPVSIERVDEDTFTVQSDKPIDPNGPEPYPVATRVTVANGRVVAMQQFRVG
jgi:ketosteroid isomerase-like protein